MEPTALRGVAPSPLRPASLDAVLRHPGLYLALLREKRAVFVTPIGDPRSLLKEIVDPVTGRMSGHLEAATGGTVSVRVPLLDGTSLALFEVGTVRAVSRVLGELPDSWAKGPGLHGIRWPWVDP